MNKKIIQQICLSCLFVLTAICISVTEVQAQTQKGFHQDGKRAYEAGNDRD